MTDNIGKVYEESEKGFKKTLELGNYELDTWISRGDVLILLGEYEAAIFNLTQAVEFHPEQAQIDYRLAGLYFKFRNIEKGEKYSWKKIPFENTRIYEGLYGFIRNIRKM